MEVAFFAHPIWMQVDGIFYDSSENWGRVSENVGHLHPIRACSPLSSQQAFSIGAQNLGLLHRSKIRHIARQTTHSFIACVSEAALKRACSPPRTPTRPFIFVGDRRRS
jgi:hypothetical protein